MFIYDHSIFINEVFFGGFGRYNEFWLRPLVYLSPMHIACFQYLCEMATIVSHFLTVCCSCVQIQCIFMLLIYQEKKLPNFFFSFWKKRKCLMCHSLVYRMMKPKMVLNSCTSHACVLGLHICTIMPIYFVDLFVICLLILLAIKVFMDNNKRFSSFIPTFLLYTVTNL